MRGAIAASDPQTVRAGAAMLDAGGTAVDAVVAAAFASFVVEPPLTSPAGGGALLVGSPADGWEIVDCMARTPGLGLDARPELDFHGVDVDFGPAVQTFHVGRGSAAAPGLLKGLLDVHRRRGRLPLPIVLEPAIAFATHGFTLGAAIAWIHQLLEPIATHSPGVRRITCEDGALAPAGAHLRNPELGAFLDAVARDPNDALRAFDQALLDGFGPSRGGLITAADLAAWTPRVRDPLAVRFHGHQVLTNPPPSSGGGLVAFALRLFAAQGPPADAFLGPEHAVAIGRALDRITAMRRTGYDDAIGDRAAIEAMIGEEAARRWLDALPEPPAPESPLGSTTHISVADGDGGAASLTTSNGEGCGSVLAGLGIHVNNFLGEEDINPGGFHRFTPGRRMSTMMAPSVVLAADAPVLVLGSGGSNRIRSVVVQGIVNRVYYGRDLAETVHAPRMHAEAGVLSYETGDLPEATEAAIRAVWPEATRFPERSMFFGGIHAVGMEQGRWVGAGDRRRGGVAVSADAT